MVATNFGPSAVDPEWWLQDSDLGDVKQLIERINEAIFGMVQDGQQQEAFDAADRLIDAANKSGIPLSNNQGSAQRKPANTSQGNSQKN